MFSEIHPVFNAQGCQNVNWCKSGVLVSSDKLAIITRGTLRWIHRSGITWLVGDNNQMHIKIFSTWLRPPTRIRGTEIAGGGLSFTRFPTRPTTGGDGGWQPTGIRPAVRGITLVCLIWHTHILLNKELGRSTSLCRDERDRELMIAWALMLNMQSGRIWYRTQKIFDMNGPLPLGSH